jgi:hypothetical protein
MKQKLYFFMFALLSITLTNAQSFTVGGINYAVTSATAPLTVKVATHPTTFQGLQTYHLQLVMALILMR